MFILLTALFLFITALALVVLRFTQPEFRFTWLIAVIGALLAWLGVLLWQSFMPLSLNLPLWKPASLFAVSPSFLADRQAWPYALSLTSLALAVILTAVARDNFPDPLSWAGTLTLSGFGLLAVLADNPLTLVLVWAAIDLAELVMQLRAVDTPEASERAVTAFAVRIGGSGLLLWASVDTLSRGAPLTFANPPASASLYLLIAAGLRLGVLPLHLPSVAEASLRRGFGTALRLVAAASSLVLLARIPAESVTSPLAALLALLTGAAAVYAGWMWVRSPDELSGRPYWIISLAALAVASALRGNPLGSVAWGNALILIGAALFLASAQHRIINRAMLIVGAWSLSSLPFSPTAVGWGSAASSWAIWISYPLLIVAQALVASGFVRQALRPAASTSLDSQPAWARSVYPFGIGLLLAASITLGLFGWDGALSIGTLPAGLAAVAVTAGLIWLTPRLRWLNPTRSMQTARPAGEGSPLDFIYNVLWQGYRSAGRLSNAVSALLEGDGGVLWALLFLVLFISLVAGSR